MKNLKPVFKGLPFPVLPVVTINGTEVFEGIGCMTVEEAIAEQEALIESGVCGPSFMQGSSSDRHVDQMKFQNVDEIGRHVKYSPTSRKKPPILWTSVRRYSSSRVARRYSSFSGVSRRTLTCSTCHGGMHHNAQTTRPSTTSPPSTRRELYT